MAAHTRGGGGRRAEPFKAGPRFPGNTPLPPGRSDDPTSPAYWWGAKRVAMAVAFEHSPCNVALHRIHRKVQEVRGLIEDFLADPEMMEAFEAWYAADTDFVSRYMRCGAYNLETLETQLDGDLMGRPRGSRGR